MFDQNLKRRIKVDRFDQTSEFNLMPRKSERKLLIFELNKTLKELALDSQESTKDFAEILEIAASLSSTRFLNPRTLIPKSDGWTEILWHIPEGQFRQLVRMDQN